jgi:hypothetical protein
VTPLRKGGNWALLKIEANTQMASGMADHSDVQVVSGPNQVGAFWIHPDVLRQLRPGQLLDQDETIGTRVEVGPIGNGLVAINEIGPAHSYSFGYELSSGALAAETMVNNATHIRLDVQRTQPVEQ